MKAALQDDHARMQRVLDDIGRDPGDPDPETVTGVADFKASFPLACRLLFILSRS